MTDELPRAVLVVGEDWTGLYLDGELAVENHTLSGYAVLRAMKIEPLFVTPDEDALFGAGTLPQRLEDVVPLHEETLRAALAHSYPSNSGGQGQGGGRGAGEDRGEGG